MLSSAWPSPLQLATNVPRQLFAAAASLVFKIYFLEEQSLPAAVALTSCLRENRLQLHFSHQQGEFSFSTINVKELLQTKIIVFS